MNPNSKKPTDLAPEDQAVVETFVDEVKDSQTLTDADVMEGGLFSSSVEGEPDAPSSEASPSVGAADHPTATSPAESAAPSVPAKQDEQKVYRVKGKEFKSAEEALAYVTGAEESRASILDELTPETKEETEPDLAELLFDDPKKALEAVQKRAEDNIRKEMQQKEAQLKAQAAIDKLWSDFYKSNPDLVGFEDQVERALKVTDPNLHPSVGLPKVADQARTYIDNYRQRLAPAKEVPGGPALVAKPTGASVPKVVPVEKPTSFMDEVRALKRAK